jgi:succinoglycan biosynthesis protein ExoA
MPSVSIVVPCFNEESTIQKLLAAVIAQDHPVADLDVLVVDGFSTDSTRARIAEFQQANPALSVCIIDNPTHKIPAALNLGINAAKGSYVVRLDAHCVPYPSYISNSLQALQAGRGWNVGGVWEIQPGADTWIARSIAAAAAHPIGVGDALYRFTSQAGAVDTVPFGAFEKQLIAKIGGFDETLLANEDYEFNTRIRQAGGMVWLDPSIRSVYFARPTLAALARQYFRYGYWKWLMLRRYPTSLRLRQAIPPLFVASLLFLPIASLAWPALWWLLGVEVLSYAALLFGAALLKAFETKQIQLSLGMPLAIASMHLSWGLGFLASLVGFGKRKA